MNARRRLVIPLVAAAGLLALSAWSAASRAAPQETGDALEAQAAFATVARVLRHPRCLNCHPSGDRPRVGEDRRLHAMNVQRGRASHGVAGLKCAACHQPSNQDLVGVPGAPSWHLAPRAMAWEGLDDHALAEALKDPKKNGGRSLAEVRRHLALDPLVLWGWDPGVGRDAPPVPHAEFVEAFEAWVAGGAVSPPPGKTSY